jgi:hypothetical protein
MEISDSYDQCEPGINVRFARAGEAFIVFEARHARVSRFSKPALHVVARGLCAFVKGVIYTFKMRGVFVASV